MRVLKLIVVISVVLAGIAALRANSPPTAAKSDERVTLLGKLAEWKYPDSKMPEGASMSDGGNPTLQSVKCQTILTTPDSIEKVIDFYSKKFGIAPETGKVAGGTEARSVLVQSDSKERPVTVQVITVQRAGTSTTLVISRAASEKETHIAWLHYRRLGETGQSK
jgi:hypothetical protein